MSSLWKTIREFRRNSKCPTFSQTKSQSCSADDSATRFPTDHEPNFCLETSELVADADVKADVKADDHHEEGFDHQNNIVPIALSTSWSDISLGSIGSFDDVKKNDDVYHHDMPPNAAHATSLSRDWAREMQQTLIVQLKKENYDMAQRMMEKDAILAEKDKILAKKDNILVEKDEILAKKEREIKILRQTASASECDKNFEVDYWRTVHDDQQEKFQALYFHACNLADDREALIEVEEKKKDVIKQQKKLIKQLNDRMASLVHEDNLEHLARQQSITTYSSSDTASVPSSRESEDKNSLSELNMDTRRQEESHGISRMMNTVDRLARHYSPPDRYHQPSSTNLSQLRTAVVPDSLFNFELAGLWMFAEDPTDEEIALYDRHLDDQLRPPPIHSPHLRKPFVNWTKLNPFQYKNLPKPTAFPIHGCSPDPEFYEAMEMDVESRTQRLKWPRSSNASPFGWLFGFDTNMGTVAVPDQVIHGYRCEPRSGNWVIDAKG